MMNKQTIDKMVKEMLKNGMPSLDGLKGGLEGMERDLMFSMIADIMKHEGTDKLHVLTTLKLKKRGEIGEMGMEIGILDLDGMKDEFEKSKYHVKSLEQQINLLKRELDQKKNVNKKLSKKLDDLRKEKRELEEKADELGNSLINKSKKIVNLESEIKELKKLVPCETDDLRGKTIVIKNDCIYGSVEDMEIDEAILLLLKNGIMEISKKNYIVKGGTIASVEVDKHGYDLVIGNAILQFGGLDEMIESGEIEIEVMK